MQSKSHLKQKKKNEVFEPGLLSGWVFPLPRGTRRGCSAPGTPPALQGSNQTCPVSLLLSFHPYKTNHCCKMANTWGIEVLKLAATLGVCKIKKIQCWQYKEKRALKKTCPPHSEERVQNKPKNSTASWKSKKWGTSGVRGSVKFRMGSQSEVQWTHCTCHIKALLFNISANS